MKNHTILHQKAIEMLLKHWSNYAKLKKSHFDWLLNHRTYHQLGRGRVLYIQGAHACIKIRFMPTILFRHNWKSHNGMIKIYNYLKDND